MSAPTIGVIGADVPRQLILAAGATPVHLSGAWNGKVSQEASELLGACDAVAARVLDAVLSGAHDELVGLIVCNDSMAHLRIFYVLRVLAGRCRFPFPVHLLDAPRGGGKHRNRFVARQYERLTNFAAACTGTPVDTIPLTESATREALLGRTLEHVRTRRRAHTLTGTAALRAYAAATCRAPEEAVIEIEESLGRPAAPGTPFPDSSSPAPPNGLQGTVPVVMTGSSHPDPTVYETLEQAGFLVVGEDHDTGDSAWIGDYVDSGDVIPCQDSLRDAFHRLAKQHAQRPPAAARSLSSERTRHLLEVVEQTNAAGVVALVRDLDDGPVWDLPGQREALAASQRWLVAVEQIPADGIREATSALINQLQTQEALS